MASDYPVESPEDDEDNLGTRAETPGTEMRRNANYFRVATAILVGEF